MPPQPTAAEKAAQIKALDRLKKDGLLTGVTSAWHLLKDTMPTNNPSKKTISAYMSDKPDIQVQRMPASHAGEKNAVSAVIPHPAVPLSAVFADTFFLAASLKRKKVYKACVLYICALTK